MIDSFRGQYYFLSNFSDSKIEMNGYVFDNAESAFHSFKDLSMQDRFQNLDASSAKKLGRKVNLRKDWEVIKDEIMREVVRTKFLSSKKLQLMLMSTKGEELIEGNTWNDKYWGVCNGVGLNKLGKILMELRDDLLEIDREEV